MIKVFEITKNGAPIGLHESGDIAQKATKNIKDYMTAGIFKSPTGKLRDSIRAYTVGSFIYITSDLGYAETQNDGKPAHIMWYLLGKVVPINVGGKIIYRKATLRSFLNGKWKHAGITAKKYVEAGMLKVEQEYPGVQIRQKR